MKLLPMDKVKEIATGRVVTVNSAHYLMPPDFSQGVSICGRVGEVFPATDFEFVHRCQFKPYKGIRRCDCGAVYTTMADMLKPDGIVEH